MLVNLLTGGKVVETLAVQAVVFDAVGTLIIPQPGVAEVYATIGQHFGSQRTAGEVRQRFRGALQREEAIDRASGWRTDEAREQQRWQRIVSAVLDDTADPEGCFTALFEHFARPTSWRCPAGVAELLTQLAAQRLQLGIASNFDRRLRQVVAGLPELVRLRHHIVISSEVGWRKPAGVFFDTVRGRLNLPGHSILYLGDDRENDYDGATAAGLRAALLDPECRMVDAAIPTISCLNQVTNLLSALRRSHCNDLTVDAASE